MKLILQRFKDKKNIYKYNFFYQTLLHPLSFKNVALHCQHIRIFASVIFSSLELKKRRQGLSTILIKYSCSLHNIILCWFLQFIEHFQFLNCFFSRWQLFSLSFIHAQFRINNSFDRHKNNRNINRIFWLVKIPGMLILCIVQNLHVFIFKNSFLSKCQKTELIPKTYCVNKIA